MSIVRFSVSLDKDLVAEFDRKIKAERCPTRSKAVGDLIRAGLVQTEWRAGEEVVGAIVLVYDHHKRDILQKLTDVQHDCHDAIVKRLKAVKGLKHVSLAAGTAGVRLS